ncbi:MAG: hypothetical protein WC852_02680 [Candidatus Nanoarchaeia archaeon]|jgi:hypothetical protein
MSGEIVKPEEGITLPKGFDDLVSWLAANYEAEPVLIKDISLDERFVQTGVQAADVLIRMAGTINTLFKGQILYQRKPLYIELKKGEMHIHGRIDKYAAYFGAAIKPDEGNILLSYCDYIEQRENSSSSLSFFWASLLGREGCVLRWLEPKPAFERLEEIYNKRKTLEGKAAILKCYNQFLDMPEKVYNWIEGLKKNQEARNETIASQPRMQAEVINKGLEQIGGFEEKLKVLVSDPLEERFALLEEKLR